MAEIIGLAMFGETIYKKENNKLKSFTVEPMNPTLGFSSEDWTYQSHKQEFVITRNPVDAPGDLTITPNNDYKPNPIRDIIIDGNKVTIYTSSINKPGSDNSYISSPEISKYATVLIFKINDISVEVPIKWDVGNAPWP